MTAPLLEVRNLTVEYQQHGRTVPAVRRINLAIQKGTTLALVGESGSGKSTVALTLMGLLPQKECRVPEGTIEFDGKDLLGLSKEEWRQRRGRRIAMVFQDPFSALNPVLTIKKQLEETDHPNLSELLSEVQLNEANRILRSYPHQLSGGQRQRVLIAMALARKPDLLIADEPTTALDVTVQDEIIKLLKSLQTRRQMSMLFITHNLGLAKDLSDDLAVMYAGQIVEYGSTKQILTRPQHPYTQGLLKCIPRIKQSTSPIPVLEGQPPEPARLPSGCPFHLRCPEKMDICVNTDPSTRISKNISIRCHLYPENQ
jgi:oligopeptide/dipeptide ABC transporter ATP-binding protein